MPEPQGVIFDFDDTLIETTIIYDRAKEQFAAKMSELGFPADEALGVLNQYDIRNVLRLGGFHKECFPLALVQTYEHYSKEHQRKLCPVTRRWMEDLGWWVFRQPIELVPGALEVLERLKGKLPLFLATKGDQEIQSARIRESGLASFFQGIFIIPDKTHQEYARIACEMALNPEKSWIVGNSMKGDINPGLRCGFNCIHVFHNHTWDFEEEEPVGPHYSVGSLREVPDIILQK